MTRMKITCRIAGWMLMFLTWTAGGSGDGAVLAQDVEPSELAQYYGFGSLEIFKLERRSTNLLAADMNNDGLTDLLLVDNSHSRIDLLQQRKQRPPNDPNASSDRSVNAVKNDWRFEHRKIPVDKRISSLAVGDLNGDGRSDLTYFGVPDRLIVRLQSADGDWPETDSFRLPGVPTSPWTVAAGDLNGDGRDDVVVLGTDQTYFCFQSDGGKLETPTGLMNTSENLGLVQIADLDGDGRNDLCYLATHNQDQALCARLQDSDGQLGPELRFDLSRPRAVSLSDIDGVPGQEILVIDAQTGRVRVLQMKRPQAKSGELASRLIQYGFRREGSRRDRDLATGDIDGDGLIDVIVTDPDGAQIIVFRQTPERGLDMGRSYPGLDGSSQVRIGDVNGDGLNEVVVLSPKEKAIGISRMESGRLSFPRALPIAGEPVALELADLDGDGLSEVVYLSQSREDRSTRTQLKALRHTNPDEWTAYRFGGAEKDGATEGAENGKEKDANTGIAVDAPQTPERLARLDANADGRPDFLVFYGSGRVPQLLTMNAEGTLAEVSTGGGIRLGAVGAGAVFIGGSDQPGILVAQDSFARSLQLDDQQQWRVLDQYNASESSARIVGSASLNLDGEPGDEIVLVDLGIKKLRLLRRDNNVYRPWKEIDAGELQYQAVHVADLNGDGQDDLLLFGREKLAVLYTGRTSPELEELTSFETKLEDTYFADVVAGDLNGDQRPDLAVVDTRSHYLEILHFDAARGLEHALHFKVFEEKSFTSEEDSGSEPREAVVADVTADGLPDLVLLSHDRVLVYPQDDGH